MVRKSGARHSSDIDISRSGLGFCNFCNDKHIGQDVGGCDLCYILDIGPDAGIFIVLDMGQNRVTTKSLKN